MNFRVEGLPFVTRHQAEVVAQRFAKRYGRDIPVRDADHNPLYYIAQNGKKRGLDGKPVK